jgi:very-short-patch-repair endonuclease
MTPSPLVPLPQGEGCPKDKVRELRNQGTTMGKRFFNSSQTSIAKARALRRTMTRTEKEFWSLVRNDHLGVKFRRQVPIGPYIVDFFCFSAKLAVELDGSQHYTKEGKGYDFHRDQFLKAYGVTVLRFSNKEFSDNQGGVMKIIWERVHNRNPSP